MRASSCCVAPFCRQLSDHRCDARPPCLDGSTLAYYMRHARHHISARTSRARLAGFMLLAVGSSELLLSDYRVTWADTDVRIILSVVTTAASRLHRGWTGRIITGRWQVGRTVDRLAFEATPGAQRHSRPGPPPLPLCRQARMSANACRGQSSAVPGRPQPSCSAPQAFRPTLQTAAPPSWRLCRSDVMELMTRNSALARLPRRSFALL